MQPESKQCAECDATYHRPARRSQAQWDRMRFCSTRCANGWRARTCARSGASFVGGPDHGAKVRTGMLLSPRSKATARKHHRKQQRKAAQQAERNRRYQLKLWRRLCLDCDTPIAGGQRCLDCNLQRKRGQRKQWNQANPEYQRLYKRAWAKQRDAAIGACTHEQAKARFDYYGGCCAYCRIPLNEFGQHPRTWHWDHVIPLSKGGTAWPSNLRPACADCNRRKCAQSLIDWNGGRLAI